MQKQLIISLLILSALLFATDGWHFNYGYQAADYVTDIVPTPDNGFVCMGNSTKMISDDCGIKRLWVFKLDRMGNLVWEKIINTPAWNILGNTEGSTIVKDFNGGYLVAGYKSYNNTSNNTWESGACLFKFTEDGDTLWTKLFPQYWYFGKITTTNDSSYIVSDWSNQHQDVIKLDRDCNIAWVKPGINKRETIACKDGGYLTYGNQIVGQEKITKYDSLWNRVWGDTLAFWGIIELKDNQIIGYNKSIVKYDNLGNILWSNGEYLIYKGFELQDRSLLFLNSGFSGKGNDYGYNTKISKYDYSGQLLWGKEFVNYALNTIKDAPSGGYIAGGAYHTGPEHLERDAGVLKLDRDFNCDVDTVDITNCDFKITNYELGNYPNPFNNSTVINYNLAKTTLIDLAIYNTKGELVKKLFAGQQTVGMHTANFNATGLNSGVYFARLSSGKLIVNKKILLIK